MTNDQLDRARMTQALYTIIAHHVTINERTGRDILRSTTIRLAKAGLGEPWPPKPA